MDERQPDRQPIDKDRIEGWPREENLSEGQPAEESYPAN